MNRTRASDIDSALHAGDRPASEVARDATRSRAAPAEAEDGDIATPKEDAPTEDDVPLE